MKDRKPNLRSLSIPVHLLSYMIILTLEYTDRVKPRSASLGLMIRFLVPRTMLPAFRKLPVPLPGTQKETEPPQEASSVCRCPVHPCAGISNTAKEGEVSSLSSLTTLRVSASSLIDVSHRVSWNAIRRDEDRLRGMVAVGGVGLP